MFRLEIALFIAVCALSGLCGCGGGSGSDPSTGSTVAIQQFTIFNHPDEVRTKFFPKTVTIPAGVNNTILWQNQTPGRHQVVSGVLTPQGDPGIRHLVTINLGNFTPDELNVDSGDTIQFTNLSGRQFFMQIVNDNGAVVSTVSFSIGEMRTVVFPGPGVWIVQDPDSQQIATITLFGHPQPDGLFQSQVLTAGGVFRKAFPVPGTFSYFDSNPDDPAHVYATGTIVVQ